MSKKLIALVLLILAVMAIGLSRIVSIRDSVDKLNEFDANISIRDIQALKIYSEEENMKLLVEFVQDKTGKSTLNSCHSQVRIGNEEYDQDDNFLAPETVRAPKSLIGVMQAVVRSQFVIDKKSYRDKGELRLICERKVTSWQSFVLPKLSSDISKTISTYTVCIGEFQSVCGNNSVFLGCNFEIVKWAKETHPNECVNVVPTRLNVSSGNRCGYATWQLSCTGS